MNWKDDANCAVMLTFDVDGRQMWHDRAEQDAAEFDKPPTVSMGEYGVKRAVPRILDMLDRHDVPAGFTDGLPVGLHLAVASPTPPCWRRVPHSNGCGPGTMPTTDSKAG